MHKRPEFKKKFSLIERQSGINICRRCHRMVHRLENERTLAREYFTLEALLSHEGVARYVEWAKKHPLPTQRRRETR